MLFSKEKLGFFDMLKFLRMGSRVDYYLWLNDDHTQIWISLFSHGRCFWRPFFSFNAIHAPVHFRIS